MLPNFIVIGAMKAGTTSLYHYLRQHPQVFMAPEKEPHFFTEEHNWHRGRAWYEALFEGADAALAVGEASTGYSKFPIYLDVPARMAKILPEARLIYLMRDPIDRIQSHYLHRTAIREDHHLLQPEDRSFRRAVTSDPSYVSFSMYATQIEQYLAFFPREQMLLLTAEELRHARRPTLRTVFRFLGIDPDYVGTEQQHEFKRTDGRTMRKPLARRVRRLPGYERLGRWAPRSLRALHYRISTAPATKDQAPLPLDLRAHLEDLLREDVRRLRAYMPADFSGWGIA